MKFHGLTDKFLTQEEKDMISLRYQTLKDDPTKSVKDRNQVLIEGYWMALHRMNTGKPLTNPDGSMYGWGALDEAIKEIDNETN